jgi:HlyD family type I secretion membrane fusion protein
VVQGPKKANSSPDFQLDFARERGFGIKSRVFVGSLTALLLVGGLGGWAATTELSGAVVGQGQVMVDKDLRAIQHLDGGIIRSIDARKGDVVSEGQVLFTLDDTQLRTEGQILRNQLFDYLSRRQRLLAERDGLVEMQVGNNPSGIDLADSRSFVGEQRLFKGNLENRSSQVNQLHQGVTQSEEELNGLLAQANSNKKEFELVKIEADKVDGLKKKGLIDGARVFSNARDLNKLKGEHDQLVASIARSKAHRLEIELQIKAVEETARTDAQKQLSELEPKISEVTERRAANADRLTRMEIRSPIAGTVNEVTVNTIGGIITPAQKLLTIVPDHAKLQVEVKIQPNDIDQLYVGQRAKLKFTAFSSRSTPEIFGTLAFVSPATSTDQASGHVFYVTQVEVPPDELAKLGDKHLMPGMLVETFIQTESRTALSYLVKPFQDQIDRAFKER